MKLTTPRIITRALIHLECWINGHQWTSDAEQNIGLTKRQKELVALGYDAIVYNEQSHMYCKRCGTNSSLQLDDYVLDSFPPRNG